MKLPPAKRIIRDLSVLLAVCGAFYAVVVWANHWQSLKQDSPADDFSTERLVAEEASAIKDWDRTLVNLEQIIERDPYDGRAQYLLAKTIFTQLVEVEEQLESLNVPSPAPPVSDDGASGDRVSAGANEMVAAEAVELEAEIARLLERGLKEFERAHQFLRYRVDAMEYLARIHVTMGQEEAALRYLRAFVVDEGRVTRRGLYSDRRFGQGMQFGRDMHVRRGQDWRRMSEFRLDSEYVRSLQFIRDWVGRPKVEATKLHRREEFREIVRAERMNFEGRHSGHTRHP